MREIQSAGGVVVNPEGKIVVVEQGGNSWSLPKGRVEEGEDVRTAAEREIFEECGIADLEYVCTLGSYARRSLTIEGTGEDMTVSPRKRTIFLYKTNTRVAQPDGTEITKAQFVTVDEAITLLTHPRDREFLQSVRAQVEEAV